MQERTNTPEAHVLFRGEYDKKGDPVTGSQPFRYRKPLQPGEVIEVELKVPTDPRMDRNQYKFEHAYGTIKTTRLPKL